MLWGCHCRHQTIAYSWTNSLTQAVAQGAGVGLRVPGLPQEHRSCSWSHFAAGKSLRGSVGDHAKVAQRREQAAVAGGITSKPRHLAVPAGEGPRGRQCNGRCAERPGASPG